MSLQNKRGPSVVVVQKNPFSVVHTKMFDSTTDALEYSKKVEEIYDVGEYNIVLTLEGTFDILRYLSITSIEDKEVV